MNNLKDKLVRFMAGRYGVDQLYNALIIVCFVLAVINAFIGSTIIYTLMTLFLFWSFFRPLSRNIYKRRAENEKYLKLIKPIKSKISLTIRRIKEIKTHRFRKCPKCKKVLRLPRKKGKHTVVCPCCHNEFEVRVLL